MAKTKTLKNGAIADAKTGVIIKGQPLEPAQARAMQARRTQLREMAKLKGLILGAGLDLPDDSDIEALVAEAGNAQTAYTAHLGRTFLKSNNLRGMTEAMKYLDILVEPERNSPVAQMTDLMAGLARVIREIREPADVIDGEVIG